MATTASIIARLQAALQLHQDGRLEKASREYKRVLQAVPDQPDALNLLGVIELSQGRPAHARDLIARAVKIKPGEANFHCNLGNALAASGQIGEAKAAYARSLRLAPKFALAHFNLGLLHAKSGQDSDAFDALQAAVQCDPSLWQAHVELARIAEGLGKMELAQQSFAQAVFQQPHSASIKSQFASFLARCDRFDEAIALHHAARDQGQDPELSELALALARTCYRAGRYHDAVEAYRQAVTLHDQSAPAWNELGRALRTIGDLDGARTCFARAVAIDPSFADAHRNMALLGGASDPAQRHAVARLLASTEVQGEQRMLAAFAMGKMLDDAGDHDAAFAAYAQANGLALAAHAAAGRRFVPETFTRYVDDLIAGEPKHAAWQSPSEVPVFVLGAPRSGTSLVEQIASTHAAVHGAGELRTIGRIAALQDGGNAQELQRISDAYLTELTGSKDRATRGIDKMPDNIFQISTILSLFPKARIIWCVRHPLDNLLSCYFQRFSSGNVFSYHLEHCAYRLRDTARLQRHWAAQATPNILKVNYESLVQDLETEGRRIIAFLGLPWDPRCLTFHQTMRPVATASGWQVRQPVYHTAVGRWRHYARHLGATRRILDIQDSEWAN